MNWKKTSALLAGMAILAATLIPSLGHAADAKKAKILMLTHWEKFKHPSLPVGEKILKEMGEKSGVFEAVCIEGYKQDPKSADLSIITADYLKQFDAIVFFTQGDPPLTDAQKKAILDFVKGGKGTVHIHCGTDSFYKWPEYGELLSGAYFKTHHPNDKKLTLKVEDPNHPATKMLGGSWTLADEFYQYRPESFSRDRVHVLLSVDTDKSDLAPQQMEKGGDYPLSWCRMVEKGRSFTTALGHRDDVWTDPTYQAHLLGGIKWVLGLEPGDGKPSGAKK